MCWSNFFCARPKIELHLVPLQNSLCWHKKWIYYMKIIFWSGTKSLGPAQYVNKCLVRQKKFGPAQNNLGPVEGQGNSKFIFCASTKYFRTCRRTRHKRFYICKINKNLRVWLAISKWNCIHKNGSNVSFLNAGQGRQWLVGRVGNCPLSFR